MSSLQQGRPATLPSESKPLKIGRILISQKEMNHWLVVSTPLKNISQDGNLPQVGMKIKNI